MLVFNKENALRSGVGAANHTAQYQHVAAVRRVFNRQQEALNAMHRPVDTINAAALIPQDVYREFENVTIQVMRENNHTLLNDLMPMAKALPVGKVEHVYRRASDSGIVVSSLGGKTPQELDKAQYDYDKSIKVIHQTGFGRGWMEIQGQRTEAFDGLVDDNANAVRALQDKLADHVYNGVDVTFDGTDAYGIKTSSKTLSVDIGTAGLVTINFATSTDTSAIRAAFIQIVDKIRNPPQNVYEDLTFYVSPEIMSNFQNYFSTSDAAFSTILNVLLQIRGVADIKEDHSLSGNEMVAVALQDRFIRPLVGMAINTVPVNRQNPFDDYNFVVWTNAGLEIKTDYNGSVGVAYIREIT